MSGEKKDKGKEKIDDNTENKKEKNFSDFYDPQENVYRVPIEEMRDFYKKFTAKDFPAHPLSDNKLPNSDYIIGLPEEKINIKVVTTAPREYSLVFMSKRELQKNNIEFECTQEGFKYRVIGLEGQIVEDTIPWNELPQDIPREKSAILAHKHKWLPEILELTAVKGHTVQDNSKQFELNTYILVIPQNYAAKQQEKQDLLKNKEEGNHSSTTEDGPQLFKYGHSTAEQQDDPQNTPRLHKIEKKDLAQLIPNSLSLVPSQSSKKEENKKISLYHTNTHYYHDGGKEIEINNKKFIVHYADDFSTFIADRHRGITINGKNASNYTPEETDFYLKHYSQGNLGYPWQHYLVQRKAPKGNCAAIADRFCKYSDKIDDTEDPFINFDTTTQPITATGIATNPTLSIIDGMYKRVIGSMPGSMRIKYEFVDNPGYYKVIHVETTNSILLEIMTTHKEFKTMEEMEKHWAELQQKAAKEEAIRLAKIEGELSFEDKTILKDLILLDSHLNGKINQLLSNFKDENGNTFKLLSAKVNPETFTVTNNNRNEKEISIKFEKITIGSHQTYPTTIEGYIEIKCSLSETGELTFNSIDASNDPELNGLLNGTVTTDLFKFLTKPLTGLRDMPFESSLLQGLYPTKGDTVPRFSLFGILEVTYPHPSLDDKTPWHQTVADYILEKQLCDITSVDIQSELKKLKQSNCYAYLEKLAQDTEKTSFLQRFFGYNKKQLQKQKEKQKAAKDLLETINALKTENQETNEAAPIIYPTPQNPKDIYTRLSKDKFAFNAEQLKEFITDPKYKAALKVLALKTLLEVAYIDGYPAHQRVLNELGIHIQPKELNWANWQLFDDLALLLLKHDHLDIQQTITYIAQRKEVQIKSQLKPDETKMNDVKKALAQAAGAKVADFVCDNLAGQLDKLQLASDFSSEDTDPGMQAFKTRLLERSKQHWWQFKATKEKANAISTFANGLDQKIAVLKQKVAAEKAAKAKAEAEAKTEEEGSDSRTISKSDEFVETNQDKITNELAKKLPTSTAKINNALNQPPTVGNSDGIGGSALQSETPPAPAPAEDTLKGKEKEKKDDNTSSTEPQTDEAPLVGPGGEDHVTGQGKEEEKKKVENVGSSKKEKELNEEIQNLNELTTEEAQAKKPLFLLYSPLKPGQTN